LRPHWNGILVGCQQGPQFHCSGILEHILQMQIVRQGCRDARDGVLAYHTNRQVPKGPRVPGVKTNNDLAVRITDWRRWYGWQNRGKRPGQAKRSRASRKEWTWAANLPTSFRETGDLHPEHGTTGTRNRRAILGTRKVLLASRTTSKLHCQSLAFEVTAICSRVVSKIQRRE
jgi:hypothetical protein